eukprot:4120896-Amphidinium_carterae.1
MELVACTTASLGSSEEDTPARGNRYKMQQDRGCLTFPGNLLIHFAPFFFSRSGEGTYEFEP